MSISVAILWHMHQPYYYDPLEKKFALPWVRLHGTKDYLDMILLLEEFPEVKVTFNLVPSLLKQIQEYLRGETDVFIEHTLINAKDLTEAQRVFILENFFLANWKNMIFPFPRYRELLEKRGKTLGDPAKVLKNFTVRDFRDLQALFNLVWIDPLLRKRDRFLSEMESKGKDFTEEEKRLIVEKHFEILRQIIPTYKRFAETGQVELSVSPFYHPILPLICDTNKAKESMPGVPLPQFRFQAPEDAKTQIERAIEYFEKLFGFRPKGMWPSEGSVSEEVINLIEKAQINWIATDEEILSKSIGESLRTGDRVLSPERLYIPYEFGRVKIFFRDRVLSDLIGFVYSGWEAEKAVSDLVFRIKSIKSKETLVVPIILDGENAWEYYENDGADFLRKLYGALQSDKEIETTTFSGFLERTSKTGRLSRVHPGSWINANFSIWIGHEEDNKSWEYLYRVRKDLIEFQAQSKDLSLEQAWEEIYIAEGSDWNWWYGDEHYTETKDVFDQIYRHHLLNVYKLIKREPPAFLYVPISRKHREIKPQMEPKGFIYPKIDGKVTGYFEWLEAGKFTLKKLGGSMHKSEGLISELYYGFNRKYLYLRLDPSCLTSEFVELAIQINILEPIRVKILWSSCERKALVYKEEASSWTFVGEIENVAFDSIFEIEIPLEILEIEREQEVYLFVEILKDGYIVDRAPSIGFIKINIPSPEFDKLMWL